jgi:molybdate transport system substrate-binding protein
MFRLLVLGLLSAASTLLAPPALATGPPGLRIAAASDLRFALEELLTTFRAAHPGVPVEASYGSSGNFFAQIREGAPFDVFLSADSEYARRLAGEGLGDAPFPYALGRLAVVVSKDSGLDPKGFGDLLKGAAIRRLAIANPAHAPYGRAAEATLRTWKVHDLTVNKLVMGDSVSQAVQFVDSGAAQAGVSWPCRSRRREAAAWPSPRFRKATTPLWTSRASSFGAPPCALPPWPSPPI